MVGSDAGDGWEIAYADGAGNAYRFWAGGAGRDARFTVAPVTPARSSSGVYSGGDPLADALTAEEAAELLEAVGRLQADRGGHAPARAMGTGSFRVGRGEDRVRFLVARGPLLAAFDAWLAALRERREPSAEPESD